MNQGQAVTKNNYLEILGMKNINVKKKQQPPLHT